MPIDTLIPIECQTDEFRVNAALKALEASLSHDALGRAWKRTQDLRDHLTAEYDRGNRDAWQLQKKLHRALYSQQFQIGQNDASAS